MCVKESIFINVHLIPAISFSPSEVWSNMTKQKVPNKISEFNTSMHEVIPPGMREDWCPVCQLHLSSQIVAISHYKGKPFYEYFCLLLYINHRIQNIRPNILLVYEIFQVKGTGRRWLVWALYRLCPMDTLETLERHPEVTVPC